MENDQVHLEEWEKYYKKEVKKRDTATVTKCHSSLLAAG